MNDKRNRTKYVGLRFKEHEHALILRGAEDRHMKVSEFIREVLRNYFALDVSRR